MRSICLFFLAGFCAFAGQSVVLSQNATVSVTIPNSSPYNNLTDSHVDFRVYCGNFADNGAYMVNSPGGTGGFSARWLGGGSNILYVLDDLDAIQGAVDLTGRTDILVRATRSVTLKKFWVEVWNGDGSGYTSGNTPQNFTPQANDWHGSLQFGPSAASTTN